jgi:hypothetical protein
VENFRLLCLAELQKSEQQSAQQRHHDLRIAQAESEAERSNTAAAAVATAASRPAQPVAVPPPCAPLVEVEKVLPPKQVPELPLKSVSAAPQHVGVKPVALGGTPPGKPREEIRLVPFKPSTGSIGSQ